MSFDPSDFLKISEELKEKNTEAHLRSLANRAYYAAFGYIKSNEKQFVGKGMSVHQELLKYLKSSNDKNLGTCGSLLETLFKGRSHSDYEYQKEFKSIDCHFSITYAKNIISKYNSYLTSLTEKEK